MQGFSRELEVDVHDIDYNGVARASALFRYIQTTAQSQLTSGGLSYDELKRHGRAFLLSRIKVEFLDKTEVYDRLTATTFPCHSRGYTFLRCYTLHRGDKLIARAISVWALVDINTRALIKVDDFELNLTTYDPLELDLGRFRLPSAMAEIDSYKVRYGDLDQNNHMNNTAYPDLYSNYLPLDKKRIASIAINYQNEAPAGEVLSVQTAEENGFYYFRTIRRDGKINTEAQITLADI